MKVKKRIFKSVAIFLALVFVSRQSSFICKAEGSNVFFRSEISEDGVVLYARHPQDISDFRFQIGSKAGIERKTEAKVKIAYRGEEILIEQGGESAKDYKEALEELVSIGETKNGPFEEKILLIIFFVALFSAIFIFFLVIRHIKKRKHEDFSHRLDVPLSVASNKVTPATVCNVINDESDDKTVLLFDNVNNGNVNKGQISDNYLSLRLTDIHNHNNSWILRTDCLPMKLGRTPGCGKTVIAIDKSISGEHCVIEMNGVNYSVRDLNSTNGTYVNGEKVEGASIVINTGDVLQIGRIELLVEFI